MPSPTNIAAWIVQVSLLIAMSIPTAALAGREGESQIVRDSILTGTVRNSVTGEPVKNASVLLWISEGHWDSTQSDAQGKYSFDSLPSQGSSELKCAAPGYTPFYQVILYPTGQKTIWNVDMKPNGTATLHRPNSSIGSPGSSEGSFLVYRGSRVWVFARASQSVSMRTGYTTLGRAAR